MSLEGLERIPPMAKTSDINAIQARMALGKKPHYVWGTVLNVHVVGDDYVILEYKDSEDATLFHGYVRGVDTNVSHDTLDQALVYVIAYKNLGCMASSMAHAVCKILDMGTP